MRVSIALTTIVFITDAVICSGVRFILGGTVYFNNSVITISDIGTEAALNTPSATPLVCFTDYRPCCRGSSFGVQPIVGEWHYPNGSMVPGNGPTEGKFDFFRTRGLNDGTVNLFRRNSGITSPFGRYCCRGIPDNSNIEQILCANVGKQSAYYFCHGLSLVVLKLVSI